MKKYSAYVKQSINEDVHSQLLTIYNKLKELVINSKQKVQEGNSLERYSYIKNANEIITSLITSVNSQTDEAKTLITLYQIIHNYIAILFYTGTIEEHDQTIQEIDQLITIMSNNV